MRPLTDTLPKPLLRVGGRPLIQYHMEMLAAAGIRRVVVNHAHLGGKIEAFLRDGSDWGVEVAYSPEPEGALETGGGMFNALPLLGDGAFLAVNGDIWTDYDFSSAFCARDKLAHLILVNNPDHHREGDFRLRKGQITEREGLRLTYSGIGVFRREFFSRCRPGRFPLAPLIRAAIHNEQVTGEHFRGRWYDVGTPERLTFLDNLLRAAD